MAGNEEGIWVALQSSSQVVSFSRHGELEIFSVIVRINIICWFE